MILPYSDDNDTSCTPYVNYALIFLNIVIFIATYASHNYLEIVLSYGIDPAEPKALKVFTHMFLHGGIWHLIGNMLFLHIYGDNVEDKLGHLGYLAFYLASGSVAAFFHIMTADKVCIGASGAVAGVMGAYVVLFPMAKIRYIFFLFPLVFIRKKFELYSWFTLSLWFAGNLLDHFRHGADAGVAFAAHIGGFICGTVVMGLLLIGNVVEIQRGSSNSQNKQKLFAAPPSVEMDIEQRFQREKEKGVPCPACVKAMSFTDFKGVGISQCFECGGLWLKQFELVKILGAEELPYSLLNPPFRSTDSVLLAQGNRNCSECGSPLLISDIEGVPVEGCPECECLWLERGQLGDLRHKLV